MSTTLISRLVRVLGSALIALAVGCNWPWSKSTSSSKDQLGSEWPSALPRVDTPPLTTQPAPEVRRELLRLPGEARLVAGNQSLQSLDVTLLSPRPASGQTALEVYDEVIAPLLATVGFQGNGSAFSPPPGGIAQPGVDLAGAARLMRQQRGPGGPAELLDVIAGQAEATELADAALQRVEGTSLRALSTGIGRIEWQYPFPQVIDGVPIEHTALVASRRDGETISRVSGTILHSFSMVNKRPMNDADAVGIGMTALAKVDGLQTAAPIQRGEPPVLVLLPYGNAPDSRVALRYAWRMTFEVQLAGLPASFLVWVDAADRVALKLEPLTASAVSATGNTWRRDPGTGAVLRSEFEIDPVAPGAKYELKLDKVSERVDFRGDGTGNDLQLDGPVDFDRPPINDRASALCSNGSNLGYQQISLFATLQTVRRFAIYSGIYQPFPLTPWRPTIEGKNCYAMSTMYFGACDGYKSESCPMHFVQPPLPQLGNYLNFAHDGSIVAHEVAHEIVQRLSQRRPPDWCGKSSCPIPVGWLALHDLADALADHIENTNCVGGWVAKNVGGMDNSLNCVGPDPLKPRSGSHDENGQLPRRHELALSFDPAAPGDHFPERRAANIEFSDSADMQIAAAALWQVREGMNSRYPVTGTFVYFYRLLLAIKGTGMMSNPPDRTDLGIYRYLRDLEFQMLTQWVTDPTGNAASTSEVLAGFARAGVFAVPAACIDGKSNTGNDWFCPTAVGGENGADAAVDVDDNDDDIGDDPLIDSVRHVDSDFIRAGGPPPTFHVWTGPRFTFAADGSARDTKSADSPKIVRLPPGKSPCNTQFTVELSGNPQFEGAFSSEEIKVDTDINIDAGANDGKECHGSWTPPPDRWNALASGDTTTIYYRARTNSGPGIRERLSTEPANGLWRVPPPSVRITANGRPDL